MIKFGSLVSFLASILYYFALLTTSTLSDVLFSAAAFSINLGVSCYSAALLPFLTDQLIGASSDELSTVIHYWSLNFGHCLTDVTVYLVSNYVNVGIGLVIIFAIPLAVIIISDCLCQQWLDRTHKSLTQSSSLYRYSTTLPAILRDAVPSKWTMARINLEDPSLKRR